MAPSCSRFADDKAIESQFGSASPLKRSSTINKGKKRSNGMDDEIREAVDVAIKIGSKLNGVCSIHFPKQHRLLRELVKAIMVDDAFACNWLVSGKIWCNVDYDSDIRKPLLTAHPVPFVQSAYEALLSPEHCSAVTVMGPGGKEIDVNDVEKLSFDLSRTYHDEEADETSSASTDDLQRDLRCLMRVVRAVATKAGLTDPELDAFMHD